MSLPNNYATKDDLKELRNELLEKLENTSTKDDLKNFATKDDLKNFATKDDLKNFATKDDLKNFATKDDLKNFATKDDLENFATKDDLEKVAAQVAINTVEILGLKQEMKSVHVKLDYLVEAITDLTGDIRNNKTEKAAISKALDRHESTLENHKLRIESLEDSK